MSLLSVFPCGECLHTHVASGKIMAKLKTDLAPKLKANLPPRCPYPPVTAPPGVSGLSKHLCLVCLGLLCHSPKYQGTGLGGARHTSECFCRSRKGALEQGSEERIGVAGVGALQV